MEKKKYAEAQSELERAIDLDQNLPEAYFYRGYIFHMNERNQQLHRAVQEYSRALSLQPSLGDAYYHRAAARYDLGRYEDCLADLERAADLGLGTRRQLAYLRGIAHYALEEWEQALEAFRDYQRQGMPGEEAYDRTREFVAELEQRLGESQ